jgi:hypothetical protein
MAERDPRTVFVAENSKLADAVVQLLAAEGIPAEVYAPPPQAESQPLTGMTELVTPDELEVRVTEAKQAEAAREFLAGAENTTAIHAMRQKRANRTGNVTVACEECGKSSEWPAVLMGTTEVCPHCSAYMDIPDPDDDWADVDFGDGDEDNGDGTEGGAK